jgi:type II secretory pathway pseudopilin PulG
LKPSARAAAGFTLIELILAVGLSSLVMLGLMYLVVPLARSQALATRGQTLQLNLAAALKTADREISEASWLQSPSRPGMPAGALEGCSNASAPSGSSMPAPLDPSRPMRWFAMCSSSGILYDHEGPGCPPRYSCGLSPNAAFGGGASPQASASFTRASPFTTVVEIDLSLGSQGTSLAAQSAAAFAGAAGTNQ